MPASTATRSRVGLVLATAALAVSACASSTTAAAPSWVPKPSFSGEGLAPGGGGGGSQPQQPGNPGTPGASSSAPAKSIDPVVVATRLTTPTAIAVLPDNTALVGERTTGRIVVVQPTAGRPVRMVRVLHGLSTSDGGGLLDLALSPNYPQDNLVFAYVTTPTDNRVIDFTLDGPVTPVLTGIPRGRSDNTARIAFAPDGDLLIATGDAGRPALARTPGSLAGKVLRVSDIGRPAVGNPVPRSPVYASGLRVGDGLCVNPTSGTAFQIESLPAAASDPISVVAAGATYAWPSARGADRAALTTLPDSDRGPGGCAVLDNTLYVTTRDGQALLSSPIKAGATGPVLGAFGKSLHKYGRLLTVVAAADGALWLTTSNRDGHGRPVRQDERVLRIVPHGGGGSTSKL